MKITEYQPSESKTKAEGARKEYLSGKKSLSGNKKRKMRPAKWETMATRSECKRYGEKLCMVAFVSIELSASDLMYFRWAVLWYDVIVKSVTHITSLLQITSTKSSVN